MAEKKKPTAKTTTKKPVKGVSKKMLSPESLSASEIKLKTDGTKQIEDLIKQAFLRFYNTAYTSNAKEKDLEHLNAMIEEYLKCYMVLGYDLNGEKICIMNAHSSSEQDALIEHLRSTLVDILNQ